VSCLSPHRRRKGRGKAAAVKVDPAALLVAVLAVQAEAPVEARLVVDVAEVRLRCS